MLFGVGSTTLRRAGVAAVALGASALAAAVIACTSFGAESTDGGAGPEAGPDSTKAKCPGALDCERYVFVTRAKPSGKMLGMSADSICQQAADSSSLLKGRHFRAWLSTDASPASARLTHGTKSYLLPDGTPVAENWDNLLMRRLHAINVDESSTPVNGVPAVWSGTSNDGKAKSPGTDCTNWTVETGMGDVGDLTSTAKWSYDANISCGSQARLYCFESD